MHILQAIRSLRRAPAYAVTVTLTLALGLSSAGAMLALVHGMLFAPLPYAEPDRLVSLQLELVEGGRLGESPAVHATYRRFATQLAEVALYRAGSANLWPGSAELGAEHLGASWISESTLRVLGVAPRLGRAFTEDETRRGGPEAVILSDTEWRMRFAAAPDVLGRTLIVNDVPREIVGVMPAGFDFPLASTRLWLPAKVSDSAVAGDFFYAGLARLAPGATPESAQRGLNSVLPRMAELAPRLQSGGSTAAWLEEARPAPRVQPLREALTGRLAATLWMLAGVAGLVLLVASVNAGTLIMVRAEARGQDAAVREALGASPLRAFAQTLGESLVLGAVAGVLALLVAWLALSALQAFGPLDLPRRAELGIGPWAAGFIVMLALAGTPLATALLIRQDRPSALAGRLQDAARGQTAGVSRQRLRAAAIVLQIAVALAVLAGAGVLLSTALRLHQVHPGFEADRVSSFRILLPFARYDDRARVEFYARLGERVAALPSVQAAGLTAQLPLGPGQAPEQDFLIDGEPRPRTLPVNVAGPGYFAALRIPLHAGRDFRALDSQRSDELIINRRAALTLFADATGVESIGRRLTLDPGGPAYRVIGVVGDVRYDDLARTPAARVYRPQVVAAEPALQPGPLPSMSLVVRSDAPPEALANAVREIVRELDPGVPVFAVSRMVDVVRDSMARLTLMLQAMAAAAAVTLLLGLLGLYGLMAYLVALRRREFGLRMALGADRARIVRGVLARGLRLTAVGVALGALLFALALPLLRATIPGLAEGGPLPLAGAAALLLLTAALACSLPALRAANVDPAQALRAE